MGHFVEFPERLNLRLTTLQKRQLVSMATVKETNVAQLIRQFIDEGIERHS